jgi:hypothetical protein
MMNAPARMPLKWTEQLRLLNEENKGRPTRLGVYEPGNAGVIDYWLEDGLPFGGVVIDKKGKHTKVEMMLGTYEHVIDDARRFEIHFTLNGGEDGVNVTDANGSTTILRFEQ